MKKFIFILSLVVLAAGCKREEIKEMTDDLKVKKEEAVKLIEAGDRTLPALMKIQEYFFTFSERVHLMLVDDDGRKAIQSMIKRNGAKATCDSFVLSVQTWVKLDRFCSDGPFYKCSPEIKYYQMALGKFMKASGDDLAKALNAEASCL